MKYSTCIGRMNVVRTFFPSVLPSFRHPSSEVLEYSVFCRQNTDHWDWGPYLSCSSLGPSARISQFIAVSRFSGNFVELVNIKPTHMIDKYTGHLLISRDQCQGYWFAPVNARIWLTNQGRFIHTWYTLVSTSGGSLFEDLGWSLKPPMKAEYDCTLNAYKISSFKYSQSHVTNCED